MLEETIPTISYKNPENKKDLSTSFSSSKKAAKAPQALFKSNDIN